MSEPQVLKLGPFIGGMNTASDPSSIEAAELVDCVNLELDLDGSLTSRPSFVEEIVNTGEGRNVAIGYATLSGTNYVFFSTSTGGIFSYNGTTLTEIVTVVQSRVALQYGDKVFFIATPGSGANGGFWDGTTWTTDANMPRGSAAVFHKSRLFVVPGPDQTGVAAHQLKFTDPINPSAPTPLVWPATNLISVQPGDGQKLIDVIAYNDNLLLFKKNSTYVLAYDVAISDAILRVVNTKVGATATRCVLAYENSIFCYHEGAVYEIINYDFKRVNFKVPFTFDNSVPSGSRSETVSLSLLGDRVVVRYFNRIYVYGLKTKTWSRWQSENSKLHNLGYLVPFPNDFTQGVTQEYFAGSTISDNLSIYSITDDNAANIPEKHTPGAYVTVDIKCKIETKIYDYDNPIQYKKLMWWGMDGITSRTVVGTALPVVGQSQTKWSDLHPFTWDQLAQYMWGTLLSQGSGSTITTVTGDSTLARKFIKFLKTLRFKRIKYQVELLTNGGTDQGPPRLFFLLAIVGVKQTVEKAVN